MNYRIFGLFSAIVLLAISCSPAVADRVYFTAQLPSGPNDVVANSSWDQPIQWASDIGTPPVQCGSSVSKQHSQCQFDITLPATIPAEATHVMVRIKAVAQLPTAAPTGQEKDVLVLAYAYDPVSGVNGNHLIHCETWGDGSNGQQIRRRVCYTEAWLPVFDGRVYLRAGKRILVGGYASITMYLEGYTLPDEDDL